MMMPAARCLEGRKALSAHCFAEARGQRAVLHRLIAALQLPDVDGGSVPSGRSLRATAAAETRWRGHVKGM